MTDYTTFETPLAHPGEHLREDYLPAYKLTAGALARHMGRKHRIRTAPSPPAATGVARHDAPPGPRLRRGPGIWLNLQAQHDLSKAAIARRADLAKIETLTLA